MYGEHIPNAFTLYIRDSYEQTQAKFPNFSQDEVFEAIGKEWLDLSEEVKNEYRQTAQIMREKIKEENPSLIQQRKRKKVSNITYSKVPQPISVSVIIEEPLKEESAVNRDQFL